MNASAPVLSLPRVGIRCAGYCSMLTMSLGQPSSPQQYLPKPVVILVGNEGQLDRLQDDCWKKEYVPRILTPEATPRILHRSWWTRNVYSLSRTFGDFEMTWKETSDCSGTEILQQLYCACPSHLKSPSSFLISKSPSLEY